jgi:hypothetical protein
MQGDKRSAKLRPLISPLPIPNWTPNNSKLEPWHGTSGGYSNRRCRCAPCKAAWVIACRKVRLSRKARGLCTSSFILRFVAGFQGGSDGE